MAQDNTENNPIFNFKPNNQGSQGIGENYQMNPMETLAENIRKKYPDIDSQTGGNTMSSAFDAPVTSMTTPKLPKVSFGKRVIDPEIAYKQLSDGTQVRRFENFIYGTDNNERLAQQQSAGEQWSNGLKKLGLKVGTAVLGNTVGSFTGALNAIQKGSLNALYTDDFNKMLDVYNERLDYTLPNYYTEEERDLNFFQSMGTANFYANDLLGGLSFTIGTVISEGIWTVATGGTSLIARGALGALGRGVRNATRVARAAKGADMAKDAVTWSSKALTPTTSLKALGKFKEPTKNMLRNLTKQDFSKMSRASAFGAGAQKILNQARFIYTSAGYEAGVEARHYMKETEEEWIRNYEQANGKAPTYAERKEFRNGLVDSANAVWGANLALVGSTNMAVFGKILLSKSIRPSVSNSMIKKKLFGVGYTMEKGTAKAVKANLAQKIGGKAYSILKVPFMEGVIEEGGQAVAAGTMKEYVLSAYDKEATEETLSLTDSFLKGLEETYTTKEGLKEVGIGALIGIFGGALTTGGRFNEISQERKNIENLTKFRNEYTPDRVLASQITEERFKASNRIINANRKQNEAKAKGDMTGEFMSEQQAVIASIERDVALQGRKEGIKDYEAYLNTVKSEELAEEMGISVEEADAWKSSKLQEYTELSDKYAENEKYIRNVMGDTEIAGIKKGLDSSTEQVIKALTYNMTIGQQSKEFTKSIVEDIKSIIADEVAFEGMSALDVDLALTMANSKYSADFMRLSNRMKSLVDRRTALENEIVSTQYNVQDAQARSKKLGAIQNKISNIESQIEEIQQKKSSAFRALGINSEVITEEDLDNQSQRIQELKERVEGYKETDPELYFTLTKLFDEYNKAKTNTKSHNELLKNMLNPEFRVNTLNGWLAGLINKNKTLDESTKEFFKNQLEQYQTNTVQGKVSSGKAVSDRTQTDTEEESEEEAGDEMTPIQQEQPTEQKTALDFLKEAVEGIVKGNKYIANYVGEDYQELLKDKPSQEEIDRYEELLGKVTSIYIDNYDNLLRVDNVPKDSGLTQKEFEELKELQRKLSNWTVLEGTTDGEGNAIADLLLLIKQQEAQVEKADTQTKVDSNGYINLKKSTDKATKSFDKANPVQTPDQVVTKVVQEGDESLYQFSHIEVTSLPKFFPEGNLKIIQNKVAKNLDTVSKSKLEVLKKKQGQEFLLETSEGSVKITVGERGRLKINKNILDSLLESSNIVVLKYGGGNFLDVYEQLENGDYVPLRGDFDFTSTLENEILEIDPEQVNNVKEGDILITRVNLNDIYNKNLLAEYRRKKNPTEEDLQNLKDNLHIYVTDQRGNIIGSLRAFSKDLSDTNSTKSLIELRRKAVDMILNEQNEGDYFSLNEAIPVGTVLIGSPNLVVRPDEQGNLQPTTIEFTDTALEKVEDVGYYEGETLTLRSLDSKDVIKTFLPTKTQGVKIPIVVLKVNGKNVAYPVNLKDSIVNKASEIDDILNTNLSDSQKMIKINEVLLRNGLKPSDFSIGNEKFIDIEAAKEALSEVVDHPNVVDWVKESFDISELKNQAEISVDLDNKPFNMSKVMLNLQSARSTGTVERMRMKFNSLEEKELSLGNKLMEYAREIRARRADYYVDGTQFTDIIDEEGVDLFKGTEIWADRGKHLNVLRELISVRKIPKEVKEAHEEGFFDNLKRDFQDFEDTVEFKNEVRADIKSAKLNKEKENQNSDC